MLVKWIDAHSTGVTCPVPRSVESLGTAEGSVHTRRVEDVYVKGAGTASGVEDFVWGDNRIIGVFFPKNFVRAAVGGERVRRCILIWFTTQTYTEGTFQSLCTSSRRRDTRASVAVRYE